MSKKSKSKGKTGALGRLRSALPVLVLALVTVGFVANVGVGTLSGFGWGQVSLLCPLGALTTMLASKTLVPRALVSLLVGAVLILALGRAFCGWVCPVPLVGRIRELFVPRKRPGRGRKTQAESGAEVDRESGEGKVAGAAGGGIGEEEAAQIRRQMAEVRRQAKREGRRELAAQVRGHLDSRHLVLLGAVVSALVAGFPVFCLVCPVGLTFATVLLVVRVFTAADATWGLLVAPALLLVEVVAFRRWCRTLCPLGALMSLLARGNKTARPVVEPEACLEHTKGVTCGACARACPEGIDLRHLGSPTSAGLHECIRCRACVDACPAKAIGIPLLAKGRPPAGTQAGE